MGHYLGTLCFEVGDLNLSHSHSKSLDLNYLTGREYRLGWLLFFYQRHFLKMKSTTSMHAGR